MITFCFKNTYQPYLNQEYKRAKRRFLFALLTGRINYSIYKRHIDALDNYNHWENNIKNEDITASYNGLTDNVVVFLHIQKEKNLIHVITHEYLHKAIYALHPYTSDLYYSTDEKIFKNQEYIIKKLLER